MLRHMLPVHILRSTPQTLFSVKHTGNPKHVSMDLTTHSVNDAYDKPFTGSLSGNIGAASITSKITNAAIPPVVESSGIDVAADKGEVMPIDIKNTAVTTDHLVNELSKMSRVMAAVLKKQFKKSIPSPHLANLRQLWPLLRSADRPEIHEVSEHLHTIVLPEELNLEWPFGTGVGNLLFVRPSQQPTLDLIIEEFKKEARNTRQLLSHHPGCIVKGTPGTGKTAFLNLMFYHAAKLNTNVILHDAPTKSIFVLRKDGTVDFYAETPQPHKDVINLFHSSTLYLFNPDEENAQAYLSPCFTVIATSPEDKHYSNVRKIDTMLRRYLSPWTLEEALAANRALPPYLRLEESTLKERFDKAGGSLRTLFARSDYYADWLDDYDTYLKNPTVLGITKWVNIIRSESSAGGVNIAHDLFHCFPKKVGATGYILGFASTLAQKTVTENIVVENIEQFTSFVKFLRDTVGNTSRSSMGSLYEDYVHFCMRNYKRMSNKLIALNKNLRPVSVLKKIPTYNSSAAPEEAVAEALVDSTCAYIVPSDPNYPAIDSFYVDGFNKTVYCFQVTLGNSHEFNEESYTEKTTRIKQIYNAIPVVEGAKVRQVPTFKYCWVVDTKETNLSMMKSDHYRILIENIYSSLLEPQK